MNSVLICWSFFIYLIEPLFSTNPTFENLLKNPTSYLIEAAFLVGFEKTHLKTRFYKIRNGIFKWVFRSEILENYDLKGLS